MRQASHSTRFMQSLIVLLIMGGAVWWGVAAIIKPAGADVLKIEVASLRSQTAEALQIIRQAEAGRLTETFSRVETTLLREKAWEVGKKLRKTHFQPSLEDKVKGAGKLADEAEAQLTRLTHSFGDQQIRREVSATLKEVFAQASELEKSLQQ